MKRLPDLSQGDRHPEDQELSVAQISTAVQCFLYPRFLLAAFLCHGGHSCEDVQRNTAAEGAANVSPALSIKLTTTKELTHRHGKERAGKVEAIIILHRF